MSETTFTLDTPVGLEFRVERETRTIRGIAVPYGDVASSRGMRWKFSKGTLTGNRIKALVSHDWTQVIGTVTLEDTDAALLAAIKVARGAEGDRVLTLAEDGVYDGLSIGIDNIGLEYDTVDGINVVKAAKLPEVSVTPLPSFDNARVTSVAASATPTTQEGSTNMTTSPAEVVPFSEAAGLELGNRLTTLEGSIEELRTMATPVTPSTTLEVTEEPIYRFHGTEPAPSGFDFATDVLAAAGVRGPVDHAALERVRTFTRDRLTAGPSFVATTDINEIRQPAYRPDMFVGQAPTPASPLYDFFHKGGLSDVTPFFYSKLDRAGTDVSVHDHVEGVEPEVDNIGTAVGATVTPSAVSGKVHITREVADQGGNPQVSNLVWSEFERSYKIALEAKTGALLTASAGAIAALTGAIAAGASGKVAGRAIEAGLVGLQFLPDGSKFKAGFTHRDLYLALATAVNDNDEPVYPIINPANRTGIAGNGYAFMDLAGFRFAPTASLGAASANASLSYVAAPEAVHVWNSGLQRLEKLLEDVEGWDIGCFGYWAGLVYDTDGLRKISYDPAA